jgi:ectoine hydroxylase
MLPAPPERIAEIVENGYTVIPDALSAVQVKELTVAMDRAMERYGERARQEPAKRRSQLYGIPNLDPGLVEPVALPAALSVVCTFLGWNIHLHHSHLDVTRPLPPGEDSSYRWHRDMQSTTYTLPPPLPLLSLKVGYFLTDVCTADRGTLLVIPGSHRTAQDRRAEDFAQHQPSAVPILAPAGSALVLDSRTWHSVGKNQSAVTRKMVYYAYSYRWIRPNEEVALPDEQFAALSPVQRQLLGAATSAQGFHFPVEEDVPLRQAVRDAGIESFTREASLTA